MAYDIGIANRLRDAGLRVVEIEGWRSRGSATFNPRGSVNHHTAGGAYGSAPSLGVCINGRSDLSGPLCQVMQSREADGNDIFYVIAAGRANHAGPGSWKGLSGNSSVYGLEIEHPGTFPLSVERQRLAARCHAAFSNGSFAADMVCQHREWNPRGKIDAATHVDPGQFRRWVATYMLAPELPQPAPPPPERKVIGDMILVSSNENPERFYLITPNKTQQVPDEEYLELASMGVPHKEKLNPLTIARHMQAFGHIPVPTGDREWGT